MRSRSSRVECVSHLDALPDLGLPVSHLRQAQHSAIHAQRVDGQGRQHHMGQRFVEAVQHEPEGDGHEEGGGDSELIGVVLAAAAAAARAVGGRERERERESVCVYTKGERRSGRAVPRLQHDVAQQADAGADDEVGKSNGAVDEYRGPVDDRRRYHGGRDEVEQEECAQAQGSQAQVQSQVESSSGCLCAGLWRLMVALVWSRSIVLPRHKSFLVPFRPVALAFATFLVGGSSWVDR